MRALVFLLALASATPSFAASAPKTSLADACGFAVIIASGVAQKTGPTPGHIASANWCMTAVAAYVKANCPITAQNEIWPKIEAISLTDGLDDKADIAAACVSQ